MGIKRRHRVQHRSDRVIVDQTSTQRPRSSVGAELSARLGRVAGVNALDPAKTGRMMTIVRRDFKQTVHLIILHRRAKVLGIRHPWARALSGQVPATRGSTELREHVGTLPGTTIHGKPDLATL